MKIADITLASVHGYCAAGLLRPWLLASVLVGDSLLGLIGLDGRGSKVFYHILRESVDPLDNYMYIRLPFSLVRANIFGLRVL